jgi:hypothetical protein
MNLFTPSNYVNKSDLNAENMCNIPASRIEGSSRFLKKAAQKLLLCWVMGGVGDNAHDPAQNEAFPFAC